MVGRLRRIESYNSRGSRHALLESLLEDLGGPVLLHWRSKRWYRTPELRLLYNYIKLQHTLAMSKRLAMRGGT